MSIQPAPVIESVEDKKEFATQHDEIAPAHKHSHDTQHVENASKELRSYPQDDGARIIQDYGSVEFTIDESRQVLRKLDYYVCSTSCLRLRS